MRIHINAENCVKIQSPNTVNSTHRQARRRCNVSIYSKSFLKNKYYKKLSRTTYSMKHATYIINYRYNYIHATWNA